MAKKLLLFFILLSFTVYSQEKKVLLQGKVIDSLGIVKNSNIVNINTNQGTSSSDIGTFEIFASLGDSLRISSIQHRTRVLIVSNYNYDNKIIIVPLKLKTYTLEEFELKKHQLTGRLSIDTKTVPKDRRDSILNNLMDFSKVDMKIVEGDDYVDKFVRPPINNTDPTAAFVGAGATAIIPFKHSERLWALRRELAQRKAFPKKIMTELGEDFFFKKLKIPIENYFHFLEYCNPLGIEKLHLKGKLLDIIKILREQSISYLEIIKKSKLTR